MKKKIGDSIVLKDVHEFNLAPVNESYLPALQGKVCNPTDKLPPTGELYTVKFKFGHEITVKRNKNITCL